MLRVATNHIDLAILHLRAARTDYLTSDLPDLTKRARVRSLDAKISALRDIHTDPDAHPWNEDR